MACERLCDFFFALYFLLHVIIVVLFDAQIVLPAEWFPQAVRKLEQDYARHFKDNLILKPPAWYASLVGCELFLQFPFLLVASFAFLKGRCRWIRMPSIIYGVHTATTLLPILAHIMLYDFSKDKHPGPSTQEERLKLAAVYAPFCVIPLLLALRMLCNDSYGLKVKDATPKPTKQKKKKA